jgi:hypothetical protein
MIKPHEELNYWQADQIAECLSVSEDTYVELWNKCVPLYDGKYTGEFPGEVCYDLVGSGGWYLLSDTAKMDVNDAMHALDARYTLDN